jgi:hypothetical protein
MNLPSKSVVYHHADFSPFALTDSTVTFMPFAPNGSYVITLLLGGGASDLSFHLPNRGFLDCAEETATVSATRVNTPASWIRLR